MNSETDRKTSKFSRSLNRTLSTLVPGSKICKQCQASFDISEEDIDLYKKLQVPPPTLCYDCRMQRRSGFYNNILRFYKKECSAHAGERVISTFRSESSYKISDLNYWWSDKWGGEDYGRNYDHSMSFFEQFKKLTLDVPHPALTHYWKGVIDSPYTVSAISTKNCYFSSVLGYVDNVNYSYWAVESKDCFDTLNIDGCESCYEMIQCNKCYNCKFCRLCVECLDSSFLFDCKNCSNCFGCFNLRNKQYYFFNERLSKEKYSEKISKINLGDRYVLNEYEKIFEEFSKKAARKSLINNDSRNINCASDSVRLGKNCYWVFRGWNMENLRYCQDVALAKDSADLYVVGPNADLCYELAEALECSNVKFSYFIRDGLNLEYCLECHDCRNCFGCIGLRNKKFHIFNKPYDEKSYWEEVDNIKTKMLETGEYGEFFPLSMSLHFYNDTYAMVEFPLSQEKTLENNWNWGNDEIGSDVGTIEMVETKNIPVDIKNVGDDILQKAVVCEISGKPFRIIKGELDFYRKNNLPIPTIHPYQRVIKKLHQRNPSRLWKINCYKCSQQIFTSYPPELQKEFKIYCDHCYNSEVV